MLDVRRRNTCIDLSTHPDCGCRSSINGNMGGCWVVPQSGCVVEDDLWDNMFATKRQLELMLEINRHGKVYAAHRAVRRSSSLRTTLYPLFLLLCCDGKRFR